jgi:putative ABC transport system permease protein
VSILSLILAMGLVESLMGTYQNFTDRQIQIHYLDNFLVVPGLLALAILVGLISGSYPALYMSTFSATDSLGFKGVMQSKSWFRNILVLFQFSVAIFLIAATLMVQKQMDLVMNESLGFNKEQVILLENAHYLEDSETFKEKLLVYPDVLQASASFSVPGNKLINWGYGIEGSDQGYSINCNMVDDSFMETMGLELLAGRTFTTNYEAETNKVILNETALKVFGIEEDPIGKICYLWNDRSIPHEVIGVVKDYHWESKHMEIRPHALMHLTVQEWIEPLYISVKYRGSDTERMIAILEETWEEEISEIPFEYAFLDEHYDQIYANEKQTRSLLYLFAGIAIFISCLGLFGLASFMAERRTKEIGIRKANGASTGNILRILSIDFTRWVVIANLVAWPVSWLAIRRWLETFAYRVDIAYWIFIAAGILAFIIALATVSFHAIRASRMNPGFSLRYE